MKKEENGYMTVEAAFWLPTISLFLVLLIFLSSYLYQGCFMMQAAYLAAFRGSRADAVQERENTAAQQLDKLLEREVISFTEAEKEVKAGAVEVTVSLQKETPLPDQNGGKLLLERTQKAWYLNPVAYIRGIMFLEEKKRETDDTGGLSKRVKSQLHDHQKHTAVPDEAVCLPDDQTKSDPWAAFLPGTDGKWRVLSLF